jgi:hypothetical protein
MVKSVQPFFIEIFQEVLYFAQFIVSCGKTCKEGRCYNVKMQNSYLFQGLGDECMFVGK